MALKDKRCVPCEAGTPPLDEGITRMFLVEVPGWSIAAEEGHKSIRKRFQFADFVATMAFLGKVAALAEDEGHHPDFCVHYNRVDFTLWTHAVGGLSENDFILASKIDGIGG